MRDYQSRNWPGGVPGESPYTHPPLPDGRMTRPVTRRIHPLTQHLSSLHFNFTGIKLELNAL